ncbi:MAG TPA: HAMP domain-containing sensor histidine kinase [Acidimicrobiales bacterium]|jgi:signal transduction histidine kinase
MADRPLLGPLGARLALAFLAVAIGAIGLLTGLTLAAARGDVSTLVHEQQQGTVGAVTHASATAYAEAGGWAGANLSGPQALAAEAGASLNVLDAAGRSVAAGSTTRPPGGGSAQGPSYTSGVVVGGTRVGTVVLRFSETNLPGPDRRLRDALVRTVAAAAGLAALLALAVAVLVSRRISRPVVALTRVARAMETGDRDVRVAGEGGPGELSELAQAFNEMADALAREDALRRALVADVAHELRTPITILRASTEALVDGVSQPEASLLSSLHEEVLRLGRMVEDLETLASAEAAGLRLERRPVDLAEVAGQAVGGLRHPFEAADIQVTTQLTKAMVAGDTGRLAQVVTNLLTNALKFTPAEGQVTVVVAPDDGTARLEVADSGVGIPAEELDHVFERFWRSSRAGQTAGSGIGLAVVAELVRAHGGSVEVSSRLGAGARFVVTLPRSGPPPVNH